MAIAVQSEIRWKRSDYITLGKAVSQFNQKINRLNAEEKKLYLPDVKNYQEIKQQITTRSELNRVINSLKRFSREGSEDIYVTKGGQITTKWERRELGIQAGAIKRRLTAESKALNVPIEGKYTRAQMGSKRVKEIEAERKRLGKIEELKGYEYKRLKSFIEREGTSDISYKRALTFQENIMKELRDLRKNSEEFKLVYDFFDGIKNPTEFFNITQKSNAMQDFFEWYKMPENYASFESKAELGLYILKQYDIVFDYEEGKREEYQTEKNYVLVDKDNKVLNRSDNLYYIYNNYKNYEEGEVKIIDLS